MSNNIATAPQIPETSPSWRGIWLSALLRPSAATYARLARQPRASMRSAYTWIAICSLVGGLSTGLGAVLTQLAQNQPLDGGLVLAIPLYALLVVLFWGMFAGCAQLAARLFKGAGTHKELSYAFATFSAPLIVVFSLLSLVPQMGIPLLLLYLYWIVLYVLAIKAVNQFSLLRALSSGLIALLLTLLVAGVSYVLVLLPGLL
jgi:hypothetical protein